MATTAAPSGPSPADLLEDLRLVARLGVHPAQKLAGRLPTLSGLQIVRIRAGSDDPEDVALAVVALLERVLDELGGGPSAEATRILLGFHRDSRHFNLTKRRERAASALFLDGRNEKTFREKDEPELLLVVGEHLYRMETGAGRQVVDASKAPPRTVDAVAPRRRTRIGVGLGGLVLLVVVVAVALVGESPPPRPEPSPSPPTGVEPTPVAPFVLRDQFTDPRSMWPHHDSEDRVATSTGGQYQVVLKKHPSDVYLEAPWPDIPKDVRAEARATKMSPEPGSFGVFCRSGGGERYRGLVDLNGRWRVEKVVRPASAPIQLLASGTTSAVQTGANIVALECAGGDRGPGAARISLSVNGVVVGTGIADPGDALPAGRSGVEVVSNLHEVRVWFDDFVVTGL